MARRAECLGRQAKCVQKIGRPLVQMSHLSLGEIHPESFIGKYVCLFIKNLLKIAMNLVLQTFY